VTGKKNTVTAFKYEEVLLNHKISAVTCDLTWTVIEYLTDAYVYE
jgi:hypothetical protein